MPKLPDDRIPKHRRHVNGQGVITLSGQDFYTGPWGESAGLDRKDAAVAAWIARGRRPAVRVAGLAVSGLAAEYLAWARPRFVKRGSGTSHMDRIERVVGWLVASHGDRPAADFSAMDLHAMKIAWCNPAPGKRRKSRRTAAQYAREVVALYKWGSARKFVPASIAMEMANLEPLSARDGAVNPPRRLSAPPEDVADALAELPEVPAAIVRLMLITGMRPAEACYLNARDIDRSGEVWTYRVAAEANKTEHRDRPRVVYLGPRAQALLGPLLDAAPASGWVFRPRAGTRRRLPYLPGSLTKVIRYYLRENGIAHFSPNQLRHSALSRVYAELGIAAAQAAGGHASPRTTLIYIDPDISSAAEREAARRAALELG